MTYSTKTLQVIFFVPIPNLNYLVSNRKLQEVSNYICQNKSHFLWIRLLVEQVPPSWIFNLVMLLQVFSNTGLNGMSGPWMLLVFLQWVAISTVKILLLSMLTPVLWIFLVLALAHDIPPPQISHSGNKKIFFSSGVNVISPYGVAYGRKMLGQC